MLRRLAAFVALLSHDAFEPFGAFAQDAADNQALLASKGKISIAVLALGGEKSFGSGMADDTGART
jgi:hypothetical protein